MNIHFSVKTWISAFRNEFLEVAQKMDNNIAPSWLSPYRIPVEINETIITNHQTTVGHGIIKRRLIYFDLRVTFSAARTCVVRRDRFLLGRHTKKSKNRPLPTEKEPTKKYTKSQCRCTRPPLPGKAPLSIFCAISLKVPIHNAITTYTDVHPVCAVWLNIISTDDKSI